MGRRVLERAAVLCPSGVFDAVGAAALGASMPDDLAVPVVIDLNDCVLTWRLAIDHLDPARWHRASSGVCVVCRRRSARRLVRMSPPGRIAVFQRIEDAIQALVLHDSGYGYGWSIPVRATGS